MLCQVQYVSAVFSKLDLKFKFHFVLMFILSIILAILQAYNLFNCQP